MIEKSRRERRLIINADDICQWLNNLGYDVPPDFRFVEHYATDGALFSIEWTEELDADSKAN